MSQGMSELQAEMKVAEELVEMFKKSPDYKERYTRYQVLYLLGYKGQRKKWYRYYTCRWARRVGVCPRPHGPPCLA